MLEPARPPDESERLSELRALCLLDTGPEERFDRLTRLAKRTLRVDIALVTLVDGDRQWFKSRQGLDVAQTSRGISFCGHAILHEEPLVVTDAALDPRFADNPLVTGAPFIRFYAGIPLHGPKGFRVGTFCVIDSSPRELDADSLATLRDFAALAEAQLCARTLEQAMRELTETESKINAALQRNNEELQTIIDHMPAMIGYWDTDLRNRFGNRAYVEWFGMSPAEMRGKHISEVIGTEKYKLNFPYIQGALRGVPQVFERIIVDQNKVTRNTLASYVPDIADGKVIGFYAFVADISQLRRAQEAEAAAQNQLRGIIDAASEFSIIATDMDGVIRLFSVGSERLLGYRADEMIGKQPLTVIHVKEELEKRADAIGVGMPGEECGFEALVARARQGRADSHEWTYVRKDGTRVPVNLVVTPVRNALGEVSGFLGVANDITGQKRLQASLTSAKEQAEAASRAKSEFVANMSHEIRTPLNAVLGMAHLMHQTALSANQQKYVEMILASGKSLLTILNDILDFSKIEAGRMELSPAGFRLGELLEAIATITTVHAEEKGLEFAISVASDVPAAFVGDAFRLQQILVNLTGNAVKFTEQGKVSVLVDLAGWNGDAAYLRFRVRDTGIGMDAEQQARLFTPFSQADASVTRRFGGTGLGLTICKRLLNLMQGDIEVHSEPGKGCEFMVVVPLPVAAGEEPATHAEPVVRSAAPEAAGHPVAAANRLDGVRILLVEDNPMNQIVARGMLERGGAKVVIAEDGSKAVEALRGDAGRYDLVLMDVQMPVMDGFTATKIIRQELRSDVPIVAMSAGVMASERDLCLASGMSDFIPKPIEVEQMFATIRRQLGGGKASAGEQQAAMRESVVLRDVFDADTLLALPGATPEYRNLVIGTVRDMVMRDADKMKEARRAWKEGQTREAMHILHSTRGAIGTLGAGRFTRATLSLEAALRDGHEELLEVLFDNAESELDATIVAASSWLARQDSGAA